MVDSYDVAVVGASNSVGELIIELLAERNFPVEKLYLLDSAEAAGGRIEFKNGYHGIKDVADFDFSLVQVALFVAGETLAAKFVPKATQSGCVVVDSSAQFRMDADVPLVVPEVNSEAVARYHERNIIASPCSSVIQMLVALKPIHDAVGLESVDVSTYHAVSGAGQSGIEELASQSANLLNMKEVKSSVFAKQIAFNVIPQVGAVMENGYTVEELRLIAESQKVLEDKDIAITPTAVWVPVFFGHSESLHVKTKEKMSTQSIRELYSQMPSVEVINEINSFDCPTSVTDGAGSDVIYIGRIREDISSPNGLNLWVVSDNARKGGALNSVQIAENLIKNYL